MASARGLPPDEMPTAPRGPAARPGLPSFVVKVASGPARGQAFVVAANEPGSVLVGSSPACRIRLDDREVSRRHASFEVRGADLHVLDLRSTNGTWVDGLRVVEAVLAGGETIVVGATTLTVERGAPIDAARGAVVDRFGKLLGASAAMRRIYPLCTRLAASDVPVLIEGETGTGKEVLAESLHEAGPRAKGPFVVFDCSAISPNLVESHLFGHERGAFTGATGARKGVFELAHGGTLFIDEIGDLELALQARLLRATERGEVCRVGSERWLRVDVRIIAATRRDLDREVQARRFRDDLYFRLAVARVELPPLRHRHGDIQLLARHFWASLGGGGRPPPTASFASFDDQLWPGNVRELHNAVARALTLGDLDVIFDRDDLDASTEGARREGATSSMQGGDLVGSVLAMGLPLPRARAVLVAEFERLYVEHVLESHGGDAGRAAAASGIARRYFNLLRARHRG